MQSLHELLRNACLIRHVKARARLTKAGKDIVGDYGRLQFMLFDTFFTRIDLTYYERWPIEFAERDTMHCFGVMQNRLDDWVNYLKFCGWCLPIPILRPQRGSVEEDVMFYLYTRLIRPMLWLGLVEGERAA